MFKCVQCFIEFWKDFHADQKWKFPELPPSQFKKRLELNRPRVDLSEFERTKWFWRRRPKLILGEGLPGYLLVVFIGVLLLFIPKIGVALDFGWLFLFYAAIALDTVRLVRWRRQYETSISRLLQSASGCKNPLKKRLEKAKGAFLMTDAIDVQQVLARLKKPVHSNNKRHIAVDAGDKEIALDVRKGLPSGYTPLFPPAEALDNAQNVNRRICYFLFVICYFISSLTRANLYD
jgi:hypothetical protein